MASEFKLKKLFVWETLHNKINEEKISLPLKIKTSDNGVTDSFVLSAIIFEDTQTFVDNTTVSLVNPIYIIPNSAGNYLITNVEFSKLESIGATAAGTNLEVSMDFRNAPLLTNISFPVLKYASGLIKITNLPLLNTINFNNLEIVSNLEILNTPNLTQDINFPKLERVVNTLGIISTPVAVFNIKFPKLVFVQSVLISNNFCTSIDISNLTTINEDLHIQSNPNLTTIILNPAGIKALSNSPKYRFDDNNLSQECVDNILSIFKNYAQVNNVNSGELMLHFGTNASPTGGATNPDYLYLTVTKSWTVNIN